MRRAVLVNGVPASGKSTVATRLLSYLRDEGTIAAPLTLDVVKEALFNHVGTGDRYYNRMLGRASYEAIFSSIAQFPDEIVPVIDAWHGFQPIDIVEQRLTAARIERCVEVWCAVSPEIAAERYRTRASERSTGHPPASYADELLVLAETATPLGLGPVVEVSTDGPIDDAQFAAVLAHLTIDAA
ncbi:MAG: AAA family ATPase [Devosiaceae bacterium]|nr:AAA family ATPase [Devosiaceae bacterium MH13]